MNEEAIPKVMTEEEAKDKIAEASSAIAADIAFIGKKIEHFEEGFSGCIRYLEIIDRMAREFHVGKYEEVLNLFNRWFGKEEDCV